MDTKVKILNIIKASSNAVSGEEIAGRLGVSRTCVWKHIKELKGLGYDFSAVSNNGYCLVRVPDRLYPWEISQCLETEYFGREYHYYDTIDSTMDKASRIAMDGSSCGTVVLSETQSRGRGRLQREWISRKYQGLYFSIILRPPLSLTDVSKITLVAGLAVLKALKEASGADMYLKWPNDVIAGGRKLCGILTELNAEADAVNFVNLGVGINVNNSSGQLPSVGTSLFELCGSKLPRNILLAAVLLSLEDYYKEFLDNGFEKLRAQWIENSDFWGKTLRVSTLNDEYEAVAYSLDTDGTLLVRCPGNEIKRVISGDVCQI